jgi:hypothetical protein
VSAFVINPYTFAKPFDMADYAPKLWLDSADSSTMFSDVAGTTQATIGDDVNLWKNKGSVGGSWNAYTHPSQTQGPPSLFSDGVQFDNNESLYAGTVAATGSSRPYGVMIACEPDDTYTTVTADRIPFSAGALATDRIFVFYAPYQGSTASRNISVWNFTSGDRVDLVSLTRRKLCIFATCNDMGYNTGRVNGIAYAETGVTNSWSSGAAQTLGDGRTFGGAYRPFRGRIKEIVAWRDSVTEATVLAVENYLMEKWGIT